MPEEKAECPECGKIFSEERFLDHHIEAEHDGDALEVPETEPIEIDPSYQKIAIGILCLIVVLLILFGLHSLSQDIASKNPVEVTVLSCDSCNYSEFRQSTGRILNVRYEEIDYRSERGKKLIQKYRLTYVPGFIFEKEVEERENFTRIESLLVEFEDAFVLPDEGTRIAQRMSEGKKIE